MVFYNTGAGAQEIADLRLVDVDLNGPLRVCLHGKGDNWRSCPLWPETTELLKELTVGKDGNQSATLFTSRQRKPLTRFGTVASKVWRANAYEADVAISLFIASYLSEFWYRMCWPIG